MNAPMSDRDRWNARYRDEAGASSDSAPALSGTPLLLGRNLHLFPRTGRALDVAGGSGQAGAILAARGMEVTVADVSDVALQQATERAERSRITLRTLQIDLVAEPFPPGPWDLITCFNYLDRALFGPMIEHLAHGGHLALSIATRSNLERHDHPSAQYLLDDGELPSLLDGLTLVSYDEGWTLEGRHTADVFARKV